VALRAAPLLVSHCTSCRTPCPVSLLSGDTLLTRHSNSLMWESHHHADPTNAWLGWGEFASDPELYTEPILNGFDAWIGAGQLLSAPALFEGMLSREVYFPKSSPTDESLYFDLHAPNATYKAGTKAIIATPLEHMGLFAREGAVIPTGKECHTVTQEKGPGRTTTDGVDVVLQSEGGIVGLDDWRGVQIFPGSSGKTYIGHWTEDDGISMNPDKTVVKVTYSGNDKEVDVKLEFAESKFKTLWGKTVHVILPAADKRKVKGAKEAEWKGRTVFVVEVA
jgi:alpha-glucosidase (family GH31 glycosyl hydrolase)